MNDLGQALDSAQIWLWSGGVAFFRIAAIASLLPAIGEQSVPVRVKLMIALCFTIILTPLLDPPSEVTSPLLLGALILTEIANGLFWGLLIRLMVLALETAGSIAAQSMSLSQLFGGVSADPQPAFGRLWVMGGLAIAMILGLHTQYAAYIVTSYDLMPLGRIVSPTDVFDAGVQQISQSFALAFSLAAPMMVASLLYNLTLGFINRAMPQLMVSFVGAPAITAGGLLLLLVTTPLILGLWFDTTASALVVPR